MCNCRVDIEKRLLANVQAQLPEGSKGLTVSLDGYGFMFGGPGGLTIKNVMPIAIEYQEPVKKRPGEFKAKKKKMNMTGNCCMFCGEKYEPSDAA